MNACLNCKKSDHCCFNSDGYVAVFLEEAKKIKEFSGLPFNEFLTFTKLPSQLVADSFSDPVGSEARFRSDLFIDNRILRLKSGVDGECVFFKDGLCSVYPFRPSICVMYPFWFKGEGELVIHQACDFCGLIDVERLHENLTIEQRTMLIKTAKNIISQARHYKENVESFVKKYSIS